MSEGKAQRLGKAAVNLGVGMHTIVEFLAKIGTAIENNPNAKIEAEVYDLILAEFSGDQKAKDAIAKTVKTREARETITIAEAKRKKDDGEIDEEPEIDYSKFKRKIEVKEAPKPTPVVPTPEPAAVAAATKVTGKKIEEPVVEVTPEPTEEIAEKKGKKKTSEIKVVGKIDLEENKPKTKGRKKKTEDELPPVAEEKPVEEPPKPEVQAPIVIAKPEQEVIRVKSEKLAGTKMVGKIDLPVEPEKKKDSKTQQESEADKHKRKRKRVAKVDISKQQEIERKKPIQFTPVRPATPAKTGPSEQDIQNQVRDTLARLGGQGKSRASKFRKAKRDVVAQRHEQQLMREQEQSSVLKLTEFVTVSELATMMNKQPTEIIQACMSLGIFASINQRLDAETLHIIAEEFGFTVEFVSAEVTEAVLEVPDMPEDLLSRPPVVTVMGHVDHGKTSLLDFIRNANVVAGEAGGITQHIGAYSVTLPDTGKKITFLDTPGHEAFTAMRARGAQVTDLAIIVIAADDSVMPQTREAISHAQAAGVPMIFALNKIDKPDANPNRIREQLSQLNILVEEWGGKYQSQDVAAKQGLNIDKLLEKIVLEAELLDLKANPNKRAHGTVIESSLDKGRGYITTLLVEGGTMRIGDPILAGQWSGRVKAMYNERGGKIIEAGPSTPVSLLGFEGAPNAGDKFYVMEDEREARTIATKRQQLQREQSVRTRKHLTIEEIGRRIALGDFKELNLIVKGDVDGSVEALVDSLQKLSTEKIQVRIIHKGVGQISESDVLLASASDAIIVGFQVRPSNAARKLAENEEIQIKLYSIIYKAIEEIREAMEGLLSTKMEERIVGTAEIREVFNITKVGNIAGCFMMDGKITRQSRVRVIRDGIVIHTGTLGSLKRFKDDVKEVLKGYEFGLNVEKFNEIKVGDNVEAFEEVEVKQTL